MDIFNEYIDVSVFPIPIILVNLQKIEDDYYKVSLRGVLWTV